MQRYEQILFFLIIVLHRNCGAVLNNITKTYWKAQISLWEEDGDKFLVISPALKQHSSRKLKEKLQCKTFVELLVFHKYCLSLQAGLGSSRVHSGILTSLLVLWVLLKSFSLNVLWYFPWISCSCTTEIQFYTVIIGSVFQLSQKVKNSYLMQTRFPICFCLQSLWHTACVAKRPYSTNQNVVVT